MSDEFAPLEIHIPQVSPEGKLAAQKIANAMFRFEVDGKWEEFRPEEITAELLRSEATRIAGVTDLTARAAELYDCMCAMVEMVTDAQILAMGYAQIADELAELRRFLTTVKTIRVESVQDLDGPNK